MTVKFKRTSAGRIAATNAEGKVVAHFSLVHDGYQFTPKAGIELAEGADEIIIEKFTAWLERQATEDPEPEEEAPITPPLSAVALAKEEAPDPHPVSGTTSPEWLAYAAAHQTDADFTTHYAERWTKAKFRTYAEAVSPPFHKRATKLFPA
jgi:hypothetical protein